MYSAAMSPPRWPVPRPSRRSWERKRTWVSILSGRMLCMAAMAAGERGEPKCFSARGFGGFPCADTSCADTATIESTTAGSTAILRINKQGTSRDQVLKRCAPIVMERERRAMLQKLWNQKLTVPNGGLIHEPQNHCCVRRISSFHRIGGAICSARVRAATASHFSDRHV